MDLSPSLPGLSYIYLTAFIFGSIAGSFLNVCIYRLPRDESVISPASHCPSCKNPVRFYENIPVISYLILRGRCSRCSAPISPLYPVVEILSGLLTVFFIHRYGIEFKTFVYIALTYSLIIVSFIDIKYMIIPNIITLPGIVAGFVYNSIITDWELFNFISTEYGLSGFFYMLNHVPAVDSLTGIITGSGILLLIAFVYKALRNIEGMGMGDVKLLGMLGAFLGIQGVIFIIFVSSLLGSVTGLSLMIYNRGDMKYAIPYGPFLSLAAVIFMFYDQIFNVLF